MREISTALSDLVSQHAGDRGIVGLAVAIGDSANLQAAWKPESLHEEPGFLAYSITKVFTSVLTLLLQEEGRLTIDSPLARWFPDIVDANRISIRQLLNHTAGIPDYGGLASYHDAVRSSPSEPWSFGQFATETFEKGLLFEPGKAWAYSNPGYMLLKRIAEELTGESYASLILDRIARPLDLPRTFVAETVENLSSLARAPSSVLSPNGKLVDTREVYHPGWVSHGVVASTASEITRFLAALFSNRILSPQSLQEMTALIPVPSAPPHWRKPSYGLGLMADPQSSWGALYGHGGAGPGYSTSVFHAPELDGRAVTATAMCAVEDDSIAEQLVFATLELAHDN